MQSGPFCVLFCIAESRREEEEIPLGESSSRRRDGRNTEIVSAGTGQASTVAEKGTDFNGPSGSRAGEKSRELLQQVSGRLVGTYR